MDQSLFIILIKVISLQICSFLCQKQNSLMQLQVFYLLYITLSSASFSIKTMFILPFLAFLIIFPRRKTKTMHHHKIPVLCNHAEKLTVTTCLSYYRKFINKWQQKLKQTVANIFYYLFFQRIKRQKRAPRSLRLKRAFVTIDTGQVCHFQL